ncbi:MAG: sigma-70 family RNA polymerase sigma factor [Oscillospiraceae bacterium]|nr:sigma-70 family RNA polymerase sigma factor [Oscillospiraceae bacterium]
MTQALLEKENTAKFEDDAAQFLQEIRRYPLLTPEEELEVAKACAQGNQAAIRRMVNSNLRLVVSVAKEYKGKGVPLLDMIQEGAIGLLSAAKNFDHTQNCKFSTYATKWIRQGIDRCVLNHSGVIRVPLHTKEKMRKILAAKAALTQQNRQAPTTAEISAKCGIPVDKVETLLPLIPNVSSLNTPVGEDGDDSLQALLENAQAPQPYEEMVRKELKHTIDSLLAMLEPRQSQILRLYFGMEDGINYSLQQIADRLEISKERTRQLKQQAMDKLKKLGADFGLEEFLN